MRYRAGSCVVCGQGTDTAVGVDGEAEWHIAALQLLGVPQEEATGVFENATGCGAGQVPEGRFKGPIRVCAACVSRSAFHPKLAPALFADGHMLPTIAQP